jgi:capsule polysaccharide export protein KpsC/LpsZ
MGEKIIDSNESTVSILINADIVVTCGGTIGLEFACTGKPVILASQPAYAGLGFTWDCPTIELYGDMLLNKIHKLQKLSEQQLNLALATAHIIFNLYNNRADKLEIGSQTIYRGKQYNINVFKEDVISYNNVPLDQQYIYSILKKYLASDYRVLVNSIWQKIKQ